MAALQERGAGEEAPGAQDIGEAQGDALDAPATPAGAADARSALAMDSAVELKAPAPKSPADFVRSQIRIVAAAAVIILLVILAARIIAGSAAPLTRQQIESKLDYLVGSTAVATYRSLSGYPVSFVMPDDGNPLGSWYAPGVEPGAADPGNPVMIDVTYQVQTAANNDYALDDERYRVTGYASPDEMTGQITVYVVERFRLFEEELSQTLPIEAVAQALLDYGRQIYGEGFELQAVSAVSVEAESGTWLVEGSALLTEAAGAADSAGSAADGAAGASPGNGTTTSTPIRSAATTETSETAASGVGITTDTGGTQTLSFSAQVTGTSDSPQVKVFNLIG